MEIKNDHLLAGKDRNIVQLMKNKFEMFLQVGTSYIYEKDIVLKTEKVKYQNNKIGLVLEYRDKLKFILADNWIIIKKDNKIIFEANMNFTLDLKPELKSFSDIFIKVDDETYILIVHKAIDKDKNFVFIELSKDYYECKTKQDAICKALDEL